LLRYLNSPLLGLPAPVLSIRHALNLLGERESVRWLRMATTLVMVRKVFRPGSVVAGAGSILRVGCTRVEHGATDLFLMGMLSLMDAILAVPIGW